MNIFTAIEAFNRIISFNLNLEGYSFSIEDLLIYFGFAGIICFIVGGLLK